MPLESEGFHTLSLVLAEICYILLTHPAQRRSLSFMHIVAHSKEPRGLLNPPFQAFQEPHPPTIKPGEARHFATPAPHPGFFAVTSKHHFSKYLYQPSTLSWFQYLSRSEQCKEILSITPSRTSIQSVRQEMLQG